MLNNTVEQNEAQMSYLLLTNLELGLFVYFVVDIMIIHFTFAASETQNKPVTRIESPYNSQKSSPLKKSSILSLLYCFQWANPKFPKRGCIFQPTPS